MEGQPDGIVLSVGPPRRADAQRDRKGVQGEPKSYKDDFEQVQSLASASMIAGSSREGKLSY
jgi:hypothetical protein